MSQVNPMQASASVSSIDKLQVTSKCKPVKKRRKSERLRLPTPPPDPTICSLTSCPNTPGTTGAFQQGPADKEAEFLEYLDTLQRSPLILGSRIGVGNASFAPAEATEAAINHLDKLYKLMGQMLTLREQNIVLHRRIMDLERFRGMQCTDKQLELIAKMEMEGVTADDYDTINAENLLYNILTESKKESKKVQIKFQKSLSRKGGSAKRSFESDGSTSGFRRISIPFGIYGDKQAKVSKWTKVKAAFKWEKASPTVSDAKSQDSGLGLGAHPLNYEVARYLRVPSMSEDPGLSPADSGAAEVSTPATLSSASSAEELHRHRARRRTHDDTSDDDQLFMYEYIPTGTKDEASTSKAHGSGQECGKHKTPWAKVKDIIQTQTRNSFKIRHRLSAKSDDFKLEDSITVDSDNEEVFDSEEPKSPILIIQSPEEISMENEALSMEHNIPIDIIARYRLINEDAVGSLESKWEKVKRAFLHSPSISKNDSSSPTTPEPLSRYEDMHDNNIQAEIQRNYLQLQKKLSLEFQEKLQEWERTKMRAASTSALSTSPNNSSLEESKEQAFRKKMEEWQKIKGQPKPHMQLTSEENLPPEFRKKLEEWKKIKKSSIKEDKTHRKPSELPKWKSFGGPKTDLENQQLSDDFLKKYEAWKQIKAGIITPEDCERYKGNKSPSPKLSRKDGSQKKAKDSTEKELQWFEKGIEREKQRLEREKQKFLDREQRLSKLRRSVIGQNKKEILVHLPSGFYRFEGISRKFTQKLYEWEKARGIRPEKSTFTLLKSSCIPHIEPKNKFLTRKLMRSKSADSVMNEPLSPLLSQRPSSLSLNELQNLEEEFMPEINSSGVNDPQELNEEEMEEPEAVIVEVEDVVEETASVMPTYAEKQFAVYQQQETDKLCAGATNLGPTVRRSESARAQDNYNLIEEVIEVIKKLASNENDIDDVERVKSVIDLDQLATDEELCSLKYKQEQQKHLSEVMIEKLVQLQEANSNVAVNITNEEPKYKMAKLVDVLDTIQDLTTELFALAESIDHFIYKRNKKQLEYEGIVASRVSYPQIGENLYSMKEKVLELRRNLSYICAASDIAVASFKRDRPVLQRSSSRDSKRTAFKKSRSRDSREEKEDINNSPTLSRQIEQGAVKKRLRYRQKGIHSKTFEESDDDEENEIRLQEQRKAKPRRIRSQNSTESNKSLPRNEDTPNDMIVDPSVVEKVLIPTKTAFMSSYEELATVTETAVSPSIEEDSPVTVFVKTTRKLFTPIVSVVVGQGTSSGTKSTDDDRTSRASATPSTSSITSTSSSTAFVQASDSLNESVLHLPPIPASPIPQRKILKEISPNIRLMMVKYNQKLSEESGNGVRSGGSSGSASPVAWRSPVLERRVKAQTEKYQQEIQKMSPLLGGRREVQKSASTGVVISGKKQVTVHKVPDQIGPKGILKSSSASVIKPSSYPPTTKAKPSSPIPEAEDVKSNAKNITDARSLKLQKAKEEFLKSVTSPPNTSTTNNSNAQNASQRNVDLSNSMPTGSDLAIIKSALPDDDECEHPHLRYPAKNRLSQVSFDSSSSFSSANYGILVKSASVGMINIDPQSYKQFDQIDGRTSLPRSGSSKKNLLSNITSKFRKVKMRRNKEKMNTVTTLCRQSLVVDIHNSSQETLSEDQSRLSIPSDSKGSSPDTSPSTSRTSSWIKRSKIFTVKKST